jgi:peroxiredoxin
VKGTKIWLTLIALAATWLAGQNCFAGKFNKALDVGVKAPDWSNLIGVDDKKHSLSDYKDADAVVLIFTCNHCPVAVAYEDRIIQLQKDYKDKNVQVVAINVNNLEADRLDKMKERAEQKGFNFPYLYDPTQEVAKDYGARVTPDVVLLDKKGTVVYTGLIDDSWMDPSAVNKQYLRDAIDAVLAGKTPPVAETKAQGCGIKFE